MIPRVFLLLQVAFSSCLYCLFVISHSSRGVCASPLFSLVGRGKRSVFPFLALSVIFLFSACSGPPIVEEGEAVIIELTVQSSQGSALKLSAEGCRQSLEDRFAQGEAWRVVRDQSQKDSLKKAKRVKVVLDKATVELVSKEGVGTRLASWFFLGPAHFWLRDHRFRLSCEPSFSVLDSTGKTVAPAKSLSAINTTQRLNFHEWSGSVTWYLLSNFVPPFWSDPDSEQLTVSLFEQSSNELVSNIERALRGKPAPATDRYEVTDINLSSESPIKLKRPKLGDRIPGEELDVELAVIDSGSLTELRLGNRMIKQPFPSTMRAPLKIAGNKCVFEYKQGAEPVQRVVISVRSISGSAEARQKTDPGEKLEIRRVVPELTSPIRVIKPREGDPIENGQIEVEIEIVAPKLISAIKIGPQSWSAPFTKSVLKGRVKIKNGRANISMVSVDDELSRVRFLCRKQTR